MAGEYYWPHWPHCPAQIRSADFQRLPVSGGLVSGLAGAFEFEIRQLLIEGAGDNLIGPLTSRAAKRHQSAFALVSISIVSFDRGRGRRAGFFFAICRPSLTETAAGPSLSRPPSSVSVAGVSAAGPAHGLTVPDQRETGQAELFSDRVLTVGASYSIFTVVSDRDL